MTSLEVNAMTTAKEIAHFLKTKYGATRVMLFGSLADGFFTERSDIDIYFEGVPSTRIFAAVGQCLAHFRNAPAELDLKPSSFCEDSFRSHISAHAITL